LEKNLESFAKVWGQSIFIFIIQGLAGLSEFLNHFTTLVADFWFVLDTFKYRDNKLVYNWLVCEQIWMMFSDSTHDPTYRFSHFAIGISEHCQKVLECLNYYIQECLFVWTFCNGTESHERSILELPVLVLDVRWNKCHNRLHHEVSKQVWKLNQAASSGLGVAPLVIIIIFGEVDYLQAT
jgi:hypothetical protein